MTQIKQLPKVKLEELGIYLKAIELDYKPTSNKQRSELITKHFNVLCEEEEEEDILKYNELYEFNTTILKQDFELESREELYFKNIN